MTAENVTIDMGALPDNSKHKYKKICRQDILDAPYSDTGIAGR